MFVVLIFFIVDIIILAVLNKGLDQGRAEVHEFCRLEYSRNDPADISWKGMDEHHECNGSGSG